MNTEFVNILKKLVAEQGKEALLNPAKCKAFLADYTHGEYKKESRLLLQAIDVGVHKAIDTTVELEICKKQQTRVLHEEYFLVAETASDVVDTLALVLRGDTSKTQPQSIPSPVEKAETPKTVQVKGKKSSLNVLIAGVILLLLLYVTVGIYITGVSLLLYVALEILARNLKYNGNPIKMTEQES